ncbi:MAG: hypothetical protein KatS3mg034_0859 [Vicingaceae bacterium]|nr:MAG: hypothetical protein KatS3mg034_0859 [Vicingaceae bacterium]
MCHPLIRYIILLFLLIKFFILPAADTFSDTIAGDVSRTSKSKFSLSFDSRYSWIFNKKTKIFGLKFSWEDASNNKWGFGLYGNGEQVLRTDFKLIADTQWIVSGKDSIPVYVVDTVTLKNNFSYISVFYEKAIWQKKRWLFTMPIHVGLGSTGLYYYNKYQQKNLRLTYFRMLVFETSFIAQYNILSFLAMGGGVGYRYIPTTNKIIIDYYNAPIYQFRLMLFLGKLWKELTDKQESKEQNNL